jgi:hypothetical protein
MKRTSGNIILIALLILLPAGLTRAAMGSAIVGKSVQAEGNAVVMHGGETKTTVLEEGSSVFEGDVIKTQADSRVKILFQDDSIIVVGPESQLQINQNVYSSAEGKRESNFKLLLGKIRVMVNKHLAASGTKFEVQTNTAVTGVRGTHFIIEVSGGDGTNVYTIEGELSVRNLLENVPGEILVATNMMTQVLANLAPSSPQAIPADLMQGLMLNLSLKNKDIKITAIIGNRSDELSERPWLQGGGLLKVFADIFRVREQSSPQVGDLPLPNGPEGWRSVTPWNPQAAMRVKFPDNYYEKILNPAFLNQILGSTPNLP